MVQAKQDLKPILILSFLWNTLKKCTFYSEAEPQSIPLAILASMRSKED